MQMLFCVLSKLCVELAASSDMVNVLSLCDFRLVLIKLFADQFPRHAAAVVISALFKAWHNLEFWSMLALDLLTVYCKDLASFCVMDCVLANGLKALFLYRLTVCSRALILKHFLTSLMSAACGCEISIGASIGKFVWLGNADGVLLGQQAVVGDNVVIMRNVVLGASGDRTGQVRRYPTVCSGVCLGASAKLLGNLNVGHCGCVRANTVLTRDLLPYNTAVGFSARVLI
ncbi:Serine acetyltransferase [Candidatus Hodgkinia cicadicola]|nr:Serine acetyltransferase [Candidatus Hodgkinia cicadicola]